MDDLLLVRGSPGDISTRLPAANPGAERRAPRRRRCRTVPVKRPGADPTMLRGPSLAMGGSVRLGCRQRGPWRLPAARPEGSGLHRQVSDQADAMRNSTCPARECEGRRALGPLLRVSMATQALLSDRTCERIHAGFVRRAAPLAAVCWCDALAVALVRRDLGTVARGGSQAARGRPGGPRVYARRAAPCSRNLAGVQQRRGQWVGLEGGADRGSRTERQRRSSR